MIRPILNINGTSAEELIQTRRNAIDALDAVMKALQEMTPNGRDYPGQQDRCRTDRELHYSRFAQLDAMRNRILDEAVEIMRQWEAGHDQRN